MATAPAAKKPVAKKPAAKAPVAAKPAPTKKPAAKKPVASVKVPVKAAAPAKAAVAKKLPSIKKAAEKTVSVFQKLAQAVREMGKLRTASVTSYITPAQREKLKSLALSEKTTLDVYVASVLTQHVNYYTDGAE